MEKFCQIILSQPSNRKAFSSGDNFFLIKKKEKIHIEIELSSKTLVSQLFVCIVHDSVNFRDKIIQGHNGCPAFGVNYPHSFVYETMQLEEYKDVLGFTSPVESTARKMKLHLTFNQLSTNIINHGNIHEARRWNLLFLTKSNSENSWKKLAHLPIQVCAEVTGTTRDPKARKRMKRYNVEQATWRCNMGGIHNTKHLIRDMKKQIDLKQKTIDHQKNLINKMKNIVNVDTLTFLQDLCTVETINKSQLNEKIVQWRNVMEEYNLIPRVKKGYIKQA